jgi:hypothetical protein
VYSAAFRKGSWVQCRGRVLDGNRQAQLEAGAGAEMPAAHDAAILTTLSLDQAHKGAGDRTLRGVHKTGPVTFGEAKRKGADSRLGRRKSCTGLVQWRRHSGPVS